MHRYVKGTLLGLLAAVCYGFIPTFTVPVRSAGLPDPSILFYRFGTAALLLGLVMLVLRKSFRVTRGELVSLIYVAFISDGSALFLLDGYNYMSTGVATTIHFMYPVVTALLMIVFYHEARKLSTLLAALMAAAGVAVLSWQPEGAHAGLRGVVIVLISAVCYALYIIRVNRSRLRGMDSLRLTFYVMAVGALIFAAEALRQDRLCPVPTAGAALNLFLLALVCTVVTNLAVVGAVKRIGSTMTAVLGALEPLTAVALGCLLLGEPFTLHVLLGVLLIIPAVVIIIFTRGRRTSSKAAPANGAPPAPSGENAPPSPRK